MTVPIRNLYYLFAYACGLMPQARDVDVGTVGSPGVMDLLARLLVWQARMILRRGLARDYRTFEEDLVSPRGRFDIQSSVVRQTRLSARIACVFDELDVDRPPNQIIKATARVLLDGGSVFESGRREDLAGLVAALRRVSDVRPDRRALKRIQAQGNLTRYRGVLAICDLVLSALLPDQGGRTSRFNDILKDDITMSAVFEEFLRSFYRLEQTRYRVGRRVYDWGARAEAASAALIPHMETDVTLEAADRVIVADAKYYGSPFSGKAERPKLHSENLYQMFAYVEHARSEPGARVDGLLIYPVVNASLSAAFEIRGHGVRAETVDLMLDWPNIHDRLLTLLEPVSIPAD